MKKTTIGIEHEIVSSGGWFFRLHLTSGDSVMHVTGRKCETKSAALYELRDVLRRLGSKACSEFAKVGSKHTTQIEREAREKRKE
jgi:hypothetical protein